MDFKEYQTQIQQFMTYPKELGIYYTSLGLASESGEVCDKIKKIIRDKGGVFLESDKKEIAKELGDTLWYIAALATELKLDLEIIAETNIDKLTSRKGRGVLGGSGDNR